MLSFTHLEQRRLFAGTRPNNRPALSLTHGPIDSLEDRSSAVWISESIDIGVVDTYDVGCRSRVEQSSRGEHGWTGLGEGRQGAGAGLSSRAQGQVDRRRGRRQGAAGGGRVSDVNRNK